MFIKHDRVVFTISRFSWAALRRHPSRQCSGWQAYLIDKEIAKEWKRAEADLSLALVL